MKVFVTGGSGFVGRNLIPHLLAHGDSVVALSRSEKADAIIKEAADGGDVSIVRGSLTSDIDALAKGMAGCDAIIHSAARIDGWGPWAPFQETNVEGTKNVVEAARLAKVARLVHIGTEAVLLHDAQPVHLADESVPMVLPTFHAPYTSSKILAERAVLNANDPDAGFATVVVRPRFVWGRGDTVNLPEILEAVDAGSCNLVEGARLAAVKGRPGQAYFLTDGEYPYMEQFLGRMMETQGRVKPDLIRIPYRLAWALASILESIPLLGYGVTREPFVNRQMLGLMARELTLVDTKARRELDYQSHMTIEKGLQEMREAHDQRDRVHQSR